MRYILKVGQEAWQLFDYLRLENLRLEESVSNYMALIIGVYKAKGARDIS